MVNLFDVQGRVMVITGGTGVLCSAMVLHFAGQGMKVAVIGRNRTKGDSLIAEVKAQGGEAIFLAADVLDQAQIEAAYQTVMSTWGRVDVLVNGAGGNMPGATIPPDKNIFDLKIDDFRQVVDLNLFGTILPTLVFCKAMVEQKKGSIINICSASAIRPMTRVGGYAAAKAAVANFTQFLAGELAIKFGEGLRVNSITPGFFITEQNRALLTNPDGSYTDRGRSVIAHTPFRRFGVPEDLLGTMQWLASDASSFVTGSMAVVDGGFDAFTI